MPSMNQSGRARGAPASRGRRRRPVMSYWKAWVSSWPITWSRSASVPPTGSTIRRRKRLGHASGALAEITLDRVGLLNCAGLA